jgi:hypothetical protein
MRTRSGAPFDFDLVITTLTFVLVFGLLVTAGGLLIGLLMWILFPWSVIALAVLIALAVFLGYLHYLYD